MNTLQLAVLCVVLGMMMVMVEGVEVTISNVTPRRDTDGNIMDIHDGNVLLIDGVYHWYGASYGTCEEPKGPNGCDASIGACGFRQDHNVSLYTSPDLVTWTFRGHVFGALDGYPQPSIMFCPKVIFNFATQMYVLWTNWIGNSFAESYYAVAISPTPYGPFKLVVNQVATGYNATGDFGLFVDNDFAAYIIYTAHITGFPITHQMSVERLTEDYLGTEGLVANSGFFGASFVEAPTLFSANGMYYAIFGSCCCYCQVGSPVYVHTAKNILGPYITSNTSITSAIPAQQTNIMSYLVAPGKYEHIWQGDRWQSAPEGVKGHDFVYFGPIVFNGTEIRPLPFDSEFTIDIYVPS